MSTRDLTGSVAVVTGGTGGIGLHTATALARAGADVVITGRDTGRAAAAVDTMRAAVGHRRIEALVADLTRVDEVRGLADQILTRHPRLAVLVNNAGHVPAARTESADGIETALAVNALAPFVLTRELTPALMAGAPARVVNLSGGFPVRLRPDDLQQGTNWNAMIAYSHAKLVLLALTLEQAHRLDPTRVTVTAVYPGSAVTAMSEGISSSAFPPLMRPFWPLIRRTRKQAQDVSRSTVSAALDPSWEGRTGLYLSPGAQERAWPRDVRDGALRARLWDAAETLTNLPTTSTA